MSLTSTLKIPGAWVLAYEYTSNIRKNVGYLHMKLDVYSCQNSSTCVKDIKWLIWQSLFSQFGAYYQIEHPVQMEKCHRV